MSIMRTTAILLVLCIAAVAARAQEPAAAAAEPPLQQLIGALAKSIVDKNDAQLAGEQADALFLGALRTGIGSVDLRAIAEALHESARTDKQVGAPAGGSGTTTVAERAGFAKALAFALERGALQSQKGSSSYSLSTTPYAAIAAFRGDTNATYARWHGLDRIGLAATFKLNSDDADPLNSVNADNLTQASVRFRITGDRSVRSRQFDAFWGATVRQTITNRLVISTTGPLHELTTAQPELNAAFDAFRKGLLAAVDQALKEAKAPKPDTTPVQIVTNAIVTAVQTVADQVRMNAIPLDEKARALLEALPGQIALADKAVADAIGAAELLLQQAGEAPVATVAYAYAKGSTTLDSNYSVLKFLFERKVGGGTSAVVNVESSIYHDPDAARHQEDLRDFAVAFSFEGALGVRTALARVDASRTTVAFSGRYQYLKENRGVVDRTPHIGVLQAKLQLPFGAGVNVPISVSFATASELVDEKFVRGQVGFSFDTDKLGAVAKALLQSRQ